MAHISDMALTNALKALQHAQIIDQRAYNEVPHRVEYCLTEKGAQLVPIVRNACQWSIRHNGAGNDDYCWKYRRERP